MMLWQDSKKLEKALGKWNWETEVRILRLNSLGNV